MKTRTFEMEIHLNGMVEHIEFGVRHSLKLLPKMGPRTHDPMKSIHPNEKITHNNPPAGKKTKHQSCFIFLSVLFFSPERGFPKGEDTKKTQEKSTLHRTLTAADVAQVPLAKILGDSTEVDNHCLVGRAGGRFERHPHRDSNCSIETHVFFVFVEFDSSN